MLIKFLFWIAMAGFVLSKQIPMKSNYITSDIFNNVYIVSKTDLQKLNEEGIVLNTYSNKNLGDITFVDATNPMRIILFYVHFNQVFFLNNKLSPLSEPILLDDLGFTSVGSVCNSMQNGFWIFDSRNSQLVMISSSLQVVFKGTKINLPDSLSSIPIYMCEHGKRVFLAFQNLGFYIFDQTGMQQKFIPINGLQFMHVSGSMVYFFAEGKLWQMNVENMTTLPIEIEGSPFYGFTVIKDKIIFADKQMLSIYKQDQ